MFDIKDHVVFVYDNKVLSGEIVDAKSKLSYLKFYRLKDNKGWYVWSNLILGFMDGYK